MFVIAKTQRDLSLAFLTRAGNYTKDPLDALRFVTRESAAKRAVNAGTVISASEACALPSVSESKECMPYCRPQSSVDTE
jgi:hypothetical protein